MNAGSKKSGRSVKIDFSGQAGFDFADTSFDKIEEVVVHVPLPSFGSSNLHIDLCEDLLDASWALETLRANVRSIAPTVGEGCFKPNITAVLRGPRSGLRAPLEECALVFNEEEDDLDAGQDDRLGEVRSRIHDYEDELHASAARLPDIVDWYFTNLMVAKNSI
jgi:hypothetical protein